MKESTFSRTTTRPLINPMNAPEPIASSTARTGLTPCWSSQVTTATANPSVAAQDRSNTPAASGTINPRASIAVIAWSPAMIWKLSLLRKVSGSQLPNTMMIKSQTYRPLNRSSPNFGLGSRRLTAPGCGSGPAAVTPAVTAVPATPAAFVGCAASVVMTRS